MTRLQSLKKAFHFDVASPDKGDWELWYELMNSNKMNTSFFGFNAGHSAWGDILQICDEEIFSYSDLYRFEIYGPATNVNHASWPVDIDEDGEFGNVGEDLCPENIFEILPDDHNEQLYYIYQSFEENDLLEYGIFSSKVLFIPKEIIWNKDGRQKNIPFKDLDYSDCYANIHQWTDMAIKGVSPSKEDMLSSWITPDCFYSAYFGLSEIAKNSPLYGFSEKPFPYLMKLHKYKDDEEELLSEAAIRKIILNFSNALDVKTFGFFYCEESKLQTLNDYQNNKVKTKEKNEMELNKNKTYRIAVVDHERVVLNMVYTEVGGDEYEVFGVYSGVISSGPHVCYFHQDQDSEFTVSDDYFEFETNHDLSNIFDELDELRAEFENWDDGELIGLSETGKKFIASNESINDEGWVEAYSEGASEDFIYDLQNKWQLSLYKD